VIRLALPLLLALTGAACGDEMTDDLGPGRPNYPATPVCQWKTPCPEAQTVVSAPDGGVPDGGLPR